MTKRIGALLVAMVVIISACSSSGGGASSAASAAASAAAPSAAASAAAPSAAASAAASSGAASEAPAASGSGATLLIWADDEACRGDQAARGAVGDRERRDRQGRDHRRRDIQTKFKTASQAGNPPDVVVWAHDVIGDLVQNGAIDPIQG